MLRPGDVVQVDLGVPAGSEAGLRRPAVVITALRVLAGGPNVVQVVPLTRSLRPSAAEVVIDPDDSNSLTARSSAQCQHVRSVATTRLGAVIGNVGPSALAELRETVALLLDL